MTQLVALVSCVLLAAACTKANPSASCADGTCTDPTFPFCDKDGVIDGDPNSCIAVSCTPGDFGGCDGSSALTCNGSGNGYDETACAAGCSADAMGCVITTVCMPNTSSCVQGQLQQCGSDGKVSSMDQCASGCIVDPAPHCVALQPKYVGDACDVVGSNALLDIINPGTFDPDNDANCTGGVITQAGGPTICVVRYQSIDIESSATLSVVSSVNQAGGSGRAIAFVADDSLAVDGVLDASAVGVVSGPGGGTIVSGGAASTTTGGGGAGFHTAGAPGGGAANGGTVRDDPALLPVMVGGPAGQGGGGGALMLIACRGTVSIKGTVAVNGGGGGGGGLTTGGIHGMVQPLGGNGGGAGGYIVIQALKFVITGAIFANGGAGGSGGANPFSTGLAGQDGLRSGSAAAVGGSPVQGSGPGGNGGIDGALISVPTGGGVGSANPPGGGGGSVGFLQTYTPAGVMPTLTPSDVSPPFQPNANVATQ